MLNECIGPDVLRQGTFQGILLQYVTSDWYTFSLDGIVAIRSIRWFWFSVARTCHFEMILSECE